MPTGTPRFLTASLLVAEYNIGRSVPDNPVAPYKGGTSFWPKEGRCLQSYGSVVLEQGRLVAYPTKLYVPNAVSIGPTTYAGLLELMPSQSAAQLPVLPSRRDKTWAVSAHHALARRSHRPRHLNSQRPSPTA